MILNSLRIFNFGLYGGEHYFDLASDLEHHRPVVLVVGHNGAGKTTFLESVRLALYGKRALGPRIGQAEYQRYLLKQINNFAADRQASVELAFKCQYLGNEDNYMVRRTWTARDTVVVENLEFERNYKPVDDIPREDWNHYLEDIIPVGVSQLFFFDGEKIQEIADNQQNNGLTEAIKSLLGIDILDQLRSDLALYKSQSVDRDGNVDLKRIQCDLDTARSDLILIEEEIKSLSQRRVQFARRSEVSQKIFEQEGGSIALSRDALLDELKRVETDLTKHVNILKSHVNGMATFALAPKLLAKFSTDVKKVRTQQSDQALEAFISSFEDAIIADDSAEWTSAHFTTLRDFARIRQVSNSSMTLSAEPKWIMGKLAEIADERMKVVALAMPLANLQKQRVALKEQLKNFRPGASAVAFEDLKKAEFELGVVETKLNRKQAEAGRVSALARTGNFPSGAIPRI